MSATPSPPERRARTRPRGAGWTLAFALLRPLAERLRTARAVLGVVLLAGAVIAALGVVAFAWIAASVHGNRTARFDGAVLTWIGAHRVPWLEAAMLEITFLGTGTVVVMIAAVAALFLALTRQRTAASLMLWATIGALVLNSLLKHLFNRPRPQIFAWGTHAATTSFPSGHAMSAAAIYGTVAFLAARLTRRRGVRRAVYTVATLVVLLVAGSRLYLGVHYPSDVAAGLLVGAAWAGFSAASLEAVRHVAQRRGRRVRFLDPAASAEPDAPADPTADRQAGAPARSSASSTRSK